MPYTSVDVIDTDWRKEGHGRPPLATLSKLIPGIMDAPHPAGRKTYGVRHSLNHPFIEICCYKGNVDSYYPSLASGGRKGVTAPMEYANLRTTPLLESVVKDIRIFITHPQRLGEGGGHGP
jgi:hypothetical protein